MTANTHRPHVVIIGGGFGGLEAAKRLRRAPVDITIVDRQNHHLFQPLLYQVATAALAPEQIAMPIRAVLRKQDNVHVLLDTACTVDVARRRVHLASQSTLTYDYLVIAAGGRTTFLGNDPWKRHAQGLKTLRDALHLRQRILACFERANRETDPDIRQQLTTFVVVGGGPLGVELAGSISELGRRVLSRDYDNVGPDDVRVVLVEMLDRLLPGFHPKSSEKAAKQLEAVGVEVQTGTKVEDVHSDALVTDKGLVRAEVVCWAPGVEAVQLALEIDAEHSKGGRLKVEQDCSLPGHPEVFAIGDVAAFVPEGESAPLPALAPVALQQGRFVARAIRDAARGRRDERGQFRYRDKGMLATVGRSRAVAEVGPVRLSGFLAWVAWLIVHLYYLIGFRNRILVMIEWFGAYVGHRRGARLMLGRAEPLLQQRHVTTHQASRPVDERDCAAVRRRAS